jgi:GAF domain-containing protein
MEVTLPPLRSVATATFSDVLTAVDRAASPSESLHLVANTLHAWGFGRVMVVLRDAALAPREIAIAGERDPRFAPDALQALPGVVWRQRLPLLPPFARDGLFYLPGHDTWVAREFWAQAAAPRTPDGVWGPLDLLVGLVPGPGGDVLGTALMAEADPLLRPDRERPSEIHALLRHFGLCLTNARLTALADRRASRLQRLQEASTALARSLDADEIVRELARQAARATDADGAVVIEPDLESAVLRTRTRVLHGTVRSGEPDRPMGDGVIADVARAGRAIRSHEVVRRGDVTVSEPWSPLAALDVMGEHTAECGLPGSVIAVPIMLGIRLLGVLAVHHAARERFTQEDEELVLTMAAQAATALANATRYAESERERRQTEALAEVARAVGSSLRPGDVLQLILRHARSLLGAEGAIISLRHDRWMQVVAAGGSARLLAGVHVPTATSLLGRVATEGDVIVSNALHDQAMPLLPTQHVVHVERCVLVPLGSGRESIGTIAVVDRDRPFTDDDARILKRLGDQVAVAIVNARLFDEVERATREWKLAFDTVTSALAVLDDARRIVRCNRRLAELAGRESVPALLGTVFPEVLWSGELAARVTDVVRAVTEDGEPARASFDCEERGLTITLAVSSHPHGGTVVSLDSVARSAPALRVDAADLPSVTEHTSAAA